MCPISIIPSAILGLVYMISLINSLDNVRAQGETSDNEFALLDVENETEYDLENIPFDIENILSNLSYNFVYKDEPVDYFTPYEDEQCGTFNHTRALSLGRHFQEEFCENETFSDCNLFHDHHQECPFCVEPFPGDTAEKNNFSTMPELEIGSKTPVKLLGRRLLYEYKPSQYVTVTASCPESSPRTTYNPFETTAGENYEEKNKKPIPENGPSRTHSTPCDECLEGDNITSLATSGVSGLTYCNRDCLTCNEGFVQPSSILLWESVRVCPFQGAPEGNSNSDTSHGDASREEGCRIELDPPPVVIPRTFNSVLGGDLKSVDDICGTDLRGRVDEETYQEMRSLCMSYYWPVYTRTFLYRNIFCYLCHKSLQSEICSHMIHLTLRTEPVVPMTVSWGGDQINIGLLTDLRGYHLGNGLEDGHERFFFDPEFDETVGNEDGNNTAGESHNKGTADGLNGCGEGFWFSFLTGKCISIHCSKGRQLSNPTTDNSTDTECLMADTDENNDTAVDDSQMYSLKLLWYQDTDDDLKEEGESVELDSILNSTSGEHSQGKPFSCDSVNADYAYYMKGKISPNSPKLKEVSFSQTSNSSEHDSKKAAFGNGFEHENLEISPDSLDYVIMSKTHSKLKQLNISSYLIRIFTSALNENASQEEYFRLPQARKMVVYFHRQSLQIHQSKHFDTKILETFSGKVKVLARRDRSIEFRSVLLQRHYGLRTNQTAKYFISKTEENGSACCDEINFKTFSYILTEMTCFNENPQLMNIHLVSPCPHVILNPTDFKMTQKQTLIHKNTGFALQRHQYLLSQSGILICISVMDSLRPNKRLFDLSDHLMRWESLLTLVFLPISMLCLLITFVTYCRFPVLRSMPGKNNMFLVFWLFWAQTLTIVSPLTPRNSIACAFMGMLLHFSWLTTLSWMCVCSFHMFDVFVVNKGTPNANRSHRWYLTWYSLLSHLSPLLVVALVCAITTDFFTTSGGSLGYGGSVVCYLNSPALVGFAFVLPLGLVLVMNAVFFSCTIFTISRIEKIKRQTGRGRRNAHIYARLSSLTGVTWILALLAEIPGCRFLRLVSVVVNSCQGIFLFISYIANRRVKRLWTRRSRGYSHSHASRSSSASNTVSTKLTTAPSSNV